MTAMASVARARPTLWHRLNRFVNTPKGTLLVVLVVFALLAAPFAGPGLVTANLIGCIAAAALLDVAIVAALRDEWQFPDGAILTGLIVALVLNPHTSLLTAVAVTAIAIAGKHALRTRWSNVLNPAALGLVAGALFIHAGQSWWGALPDLGLAGLVLLAAPGIYLADRINKLPLVSLFLGSYFALFTLASFVGEPTSVAEIFRTPDLQAALFFAFFMLDDPPTCPVRYEDQVVFGAIVGAVSFGVFKLFGVDYFLVTGLLAGNAWESARRVWVHQASRRARPAAHSISRHSDATAARR